MLYRYCRRNAPFVESRLAMGVLFSLILAANVFPQEQPSQPETQPVSSDLRSTTVTIPAGTQIALVFTNPIQSRYIHHGDPIYAQFNSTVNSGNEVVIPLGTLLQGKVDKLERKGGRGVIRVEAMSITFPDGYVAPVPGKATIETSDGYALKDPGSARTTAAFILPLAGAGGGALIGHAVANPQPTTITSTLPPGCTGPPPGCLSSSVTTPGSSGKDIVIGAAIGGGIGFAASLALIFGSHNFFMEAGSPADMTLEEPLTLQRERVAEAVKQSEQHPAPRPQIAGPPPPPPVAVQPAPDHGTCYTPGTPGTPPTIIPGTPPSGDFPGTPPTVIPGTPPTPGTPYPCP